MDPSTYFWQVQAGKLPKPMAAKTLGMTVEQIDQQTCTLQATFIGKPEFTNTAGHVQGGFLSAMLDDAMRSALAAMRAAGEFAPTVHLSIQFIRATRPWELHTMRHGCPAWRQHLPSVWRAVSTRQSDCHSINYCHHSEAVGQ